MQKEWLVSQFGESWVNRLSSFILSKEFEILGNTIKELRKTKIIYPESKDVFRAFRETPFNEVKVVIIGQDCYYNGAADGLCFSAKEAGILGSKIKYPASLIQIMEALERTVYRGLLLDKNPDLTRWANQGVFLFNTGLTVQKDMPESHLAMWKPFTVEVLKALSEYNTGVIYCLWGAKAQQYEKYINPKFNYILKAKHPSSASYNGGIWECNHFVEINKILKENNNTEIIW